MFPPELETAPSPGCEALSWAHPVVREWFIGRFGRPTEPQELGWPRIEGGEPTLISAPTGSGKTLAAFLICIDKLIRKAISGSLDSHTEVVYVSPLKALSNDVQKNLEAPLREIQQLALERGYLCPQIRTAVRTGDTLPAERQAMLKRPPHILVTTPESLYILLTAEKSRNNLRRVETVIVDEIHAVADDKRGAHLALTLERLDALVCGENRLSPGALITGSRSLRSASGSRQPRTRSSWWRNFLVESARARWPSCRWASGARWIWASRRPAGNWGRLPATLSGTTSMRGWPSWPCNIARPWCLSTRGAWRSG